MNKVCNYIAFPNSFVSSHSYVEKCYGLCLGLEGYFSLYGIESYSPKCTLQRWF